MKKSISRSKARRSPSSVNSPSSSRDQKAWNVPSDLEDAEQVVEPVVEGVRVALDVEEQVARRRRRERWRARAPARCGSPGFGQQQLVACVAGPASLELDAGPARGRGQSARALVPSRGGLHRQRRGRRAPRASRRRARCRARRCRADDPGDEAQVVVVAAPLRRIRRPSGRRRSARRAPGRSPPAGTAAGVSSAIVARNRSRALR